MSIDGLKDLLVSSRPMNATRWLVDGVIAAGAFGFGMLQMTIAVNLLLPDEFTRLMLGIRALAPSALAITGILLTCLPLIGRERLPWPAFALCTGFWFLFTHLLGIGTLSLVGPLIALFTVAYDRSRTECLTAGILLLGCVLVVPFLTPGPASPFNNLILLQNATLVVAVSLAGYAFHVREDFLEAAETRALQAEQLQEAERLRAEEAFRTAEAEASQRVEAERVRIARELHDVTAHSLSAVSIQAAVAERLLESDPEAAKQAIVKVRKVAKEALGDMRAMVGVLRGDEDAQMEPTEGTDRMGSLVEYLEGAGVECDLFMYGYDRAVVPAHVDVALFGIVREACTNIVRHAQATKATIDLRDLGESIVLYVCDDGCGMPDGLTASGHGIEGMAERIRLLDGAFAVTERSEGGTCVQASIPATWKGRAHDQR